MTLPFTASEFFGVFRAYHGTWGYAPAVLLVLAATCLYMANRPRPRSDRFVSAVLALLWIWTGAVYHLAYFAVINPAAYAFGVVSIAGGLVFCWLGIVRGQLEFRAGRDARGLAGWALVAYACVAYPALTVLAGHRYPDMPTFGLPCPTTLFTIGLLAWLKRPYPRLALAVPLLWCFVGLQAALLLDMPPDYALAFAAIIGLWEVRPAPRRTA